MGKKDTERRVYTTEFKAEAVAQARIAKAMVNGNMKLVRELQRDEL
jgi:transposase-like protein